MPDRHKISRHLLPFIQEGESVEKVKSANHSLSVLGNLMIIHDFQPFSPEAYLHSLKNNPEFKDKPIEIAYGLLVTAGIIQVIDTVQSRIDPNILSQVIS